MPKILNRPPGAAPANAQVPVLSAGWLDHARTQPFPVQVGSVAAGRSGGTAQDTIVWNPNEIPSVPAWASEIDIMCELPVAITLPASGGAVRFSPFAPYSAISLQLLLSGSPMWPNNMSLVPWWLDEIVNTAAGFDPFMVGPVLSNGDLPSATTPWFNQGPTALQTTWDAGTNDYGPGETVTNATTAAVTVNTKIRWTSRIRLQRRRNQMWGMIPLGDPKNRPVVRAQLNALVGQQPENCLMMDTGTGTPTAVVDTGGVILNMVFRAKSLDALPDGAAVNAPQVGFGLNVTYDQSPPNANAGQIYNEQFQTAMLYTSIHQLLVNSEYALNPDYISLWLNQQRQSARYEYDLGAGTLQDYYQDNLRKYRRMLPDGHMLYDLEGGDFPDVKSVTPYVALMSPDASYAAAVGVAATPNMCTAWRLPTGTSISASYTASYAFGLIQVPY